MIYEEYRQRRYVTRALRALDEKAKELGVDKISLLVFGHNHAAQTLYQKAGYEASGIHMTKKAG